MAKGFTISGEDVSDPAKVSFDVYSDETPEVMKDGIISMDALERINGGPFEDAAATFDEYREQIAARAGEHWNANPLNGVIVLGRGDF